MDAENWHEKMNHEVIIWPVIMQACPSLSCAPPPTHTHTHHTTHTHHIQCFHHKLLSHHYTIVSTMISAVLSLASDLPMLPTRLVAQVGHREREGGRMRREGGRVDGEGAREEGDIQVGGGYGRKRVREGGMKEKKRGEVERGRRRKEICFGTMTLSQISFLLPSSFTLSPSSSLLFPYPHFYVSLFL